MAQHDSQKTSQTQHTQHGSESNPIRLLLGLLASLLPTWRHRINRHNLPLDFQAGLTGAILMFPQAMAYAAIAGLPPIYGIYCAIIPTILAAYFGSSFHLVSGPTAAISLFLFSTVNPIALSSGQDYFSLILLVTLMCGAIQFLLGIFRMGAIVNFVSDSVIIGFTAGAGLLIMASQLANLLGVPKDNAHNLIDFIYNIFQNIDMINPYAVIVGVFTMAMAVVGMYAPYIKRIPYLIFSLISGCIMAFGLNYFAGGPEVTGLKPLGSIQSIIPPISIPPMSIDLIVQLFPTALALALLGLTEAISITRSIALKSGQIVNTNREFVGQGISNIGGAFFSGFASSGSFTRSGANYESKAKSPLAAIISSVFVFILGLAFAPLVSYLVTPVLAGSLIIIALKIIGVTHILKLHRSSRRATIVMWVAFFSAIFIGLEFAIFAGAGLSMLFYLDRVSHPTISFAKASKQKNAYHFLHSRRVTDCPQLLVLFIDGSIFFGATDYAYERINNLRKQFPDRKYLMLICSGVNHLDIHGADLFKRLTLQQRNQGGDVFFSDVKSAAMRVLIATENYKIIGRKNFYNIGPSTMEDIYHRMDPFICDHCPELAFKVCKRIAAEKSAKAESTDNTWHVEMSTKDTSS